MAGLACLAIWQAASCHPSPGPKPAIAIQHEITPWPARAGQATLVLRIRDTSRRAVHGAHIGIEADMSHAGMRPEFSEMHEVANGAYRGQLTFTMPGDWVILLHITLPGGDKLDRQLEVPGVRAN